MIIGPLVKLPPDLLSSPSTADLSSGIERVKYFKLLGINIVIISAGKHVLM